MVTKIKHFDSCKYQTRIYNLEGHSKIKQFERFHKPKSCCSPKTLVSEKQTRIKTQKYLACIRTLASNLTIN